MRGALETVAIAFGMFSAVPLPQPEWKEKNMRYMLCVFPLIGVLIGALCLLWVMLAQWLHVPELLRGAGLCLLPVAVTGGIHLDGYADTSDARASHASPERRQEILKDPHCGAFAVIRLGMYFVASLALCTALMPTTRNLLCLGLSFVLSRALSAYAVARFPMAKDTGLAHTFGAASDKKRVSRVLIALSVVVAIGLPVLGGLAGGCMVAAALLTFWRYDAVARREFGGISGDLAGWFLQKAELWMLAALVLEPLVRGMFL